MDSEVNNKRQQDSSSLSNQVVIVMVTITIRLPDWSCKSNENIIEKKLSRLSRKSQVQKEICY